jgi:hypothetical protein
MQSQARVWTGGDALPIGFKPSRVLHKNPAESSTRNALAACVPLGRFKMKTACAIV